MLEVLFAILIILKLFNLINVSWLLVTAPMWIQLVIVVIYICFAYLFGWHKDKQKRAKITIEEDK